MTQNVPKKMNLASLPSDPLKMSLNRFFQPFEVIGDHQVHATKSPALEITQHVFPRGSIFAVSKGESQDLPLLFFRNYAVVLPDLDHQGSQQEEQIRASQPPVSLMVNPGQKTCDQGILRGLRKPGTTQLFRDMRDLPRRDSLDHHPHQRQNQGLFRALVASEQIGRKISPSLVLGTRRISVPACIVSCRSRYPFQYSVRSLGCSWRSAHRGSAIWASKTCSRPTRPDFQSSSFIGQKGLEMFGIQSNVEFGHRFFQVEIRFVLVTTIFRKINGFFNFSHH